jgi:hypothetical protein
MKETIQKLKSSGVIDTIFCAAVAVASIGGWIWLCASIASTPLLPLM